MTDHNATFVHVAVAVIINSKNEVLLALRPDEVHQGGLWEFPGGKLEPDESPLEALLRECREELGIFVVSGYPLIKLKHEYDDRTVLLDVFVVDEYKGEASGQEGQQIEWVAANRLQHKEMPAADVAIIQAVNLPEFYLITPEPSMPDEEFLGIVDKRLSDGIRLIQFRAKNISEEKYRNLSSRLMQLTQSYDARLMLNISLQEYSMYPSDGIHLDSRKLMTCQQRPVKASVLFSASCHNLEQVQQANRLQADFIMISPVQPTTSHPDATPLGWPGFSELCDMANMPVFALGGMRPSDVDTARAYGGQGVAAISALWNLNNE